MSISGGDHHHYHRLRAKMNNMAKNTTAAICLREIADSLRVCPIMYGRNRLQLPDQIETIHDHRSQTITVHDATD